MNSWDGIYPAEPRCKYCGKVAMECDCEYFSTSQLVESEPCS